MYISRCVTLYVHLLSYTVLHHHASLHVVLHFLTSPHIINSVAKATDLTIVAHFQKQLGNCCASLKAESAVLAIVDWRGGQHKYRVTTSNAA